MLKTVTLQILEKEVFLAGFLSPGCPDFLLLCHSIYRHGWAGAVGGFGDRDSPWLPGECLGPCVYRDRLCFSRAGCLLPLGTGDLFELLCVSFLWPDLIQIGSVFARVTFHLSITAGTCVNHWHSCSFCYLMQLGLKLGWCPRGNSLEIHISEHTRNILTCRRCGVTGIATWSKLTSFHMKEFDMKYWNETSLLTWLFPSFTND